MQADHEKTIEELKARISELEEILNWYVDYDDTNEGDQPVEHLGGRTWDEVNAPHGSRCFDERKPSLVDEKTNDLLCESCGQPIPARSKV